MLSGRLKIDISYLRKDNILIYPVYSENGEKILDARIPVTEGKREEIIKKYGNIVYYSFSGEMENIPNHIITKAFHSSREIMDEVTRTNSLSKHGYQKAEDLVENMIGGLNKTNTNTIKLVKTLKSFDDYTYNHSVNVLILAAVFSSKLKLFSSEEMKSFLLGAFLHDIGKVMIDKQILNKNRNLNSMEFKKIKRHPHLGYELIKSIDSYNTVIQQSVLFHHEKYNGKGYFGFLYEYLPDYPKIISICDIFDALTTKRPYRDATSPAATLRMIVNSINNHFDYELVNKFINEMGPILNNMQCFYNKHEICALNTDELAFIKTPGDKDLLEPEIIVFCRFTGSKNKINVNFYDKPIYVDLEQDPSRHMVKLLSNNKQVAFIKDRLLERSLLTNCTLEKYKDHGFIQ